MYVSANVTPFVKMRVGKMAYCRKSYAPVLMEYSWQTPCGLAYPRAADWPQIPSIENLNLPQVPPFLMLNAMGKPSPKFLCGVTFGANAVGWHLKLIPQSSL